MMDWIGRFHPLLVHLPIGILLLALAFDLAGRSRRFRAASAAKPLALLLGGLAAACSCLTGYALSQGGEYDPDTLSRHQWLGIGVAAAALAAYALHFRGKIEASRWAMWLLLPGIVATGHLGGTLTHGADFLTKPAETPPPKLDPDTALAYRDVVAPILKQRCGACHGPSKQKGRLRLDQPAALLRGGEHGPVLLAGRPDSSELLRRILLPPDDEQHMPPRTRGQVTPAELSLLQRWVETGADMGKATVREMTK